MKPILFNSDMVCAILESRKTVTRRVVKPQPEKSAYSPYVGVGGRVSFRIGERGCTDPYKPPYRLGDILYVRETWCPFDSDHVINGVKYAYKADSTPESERVRKDFGYKWRPSIHMPREAARIFLRVTDVRVERLQHLGIEEALKEGITPTNRPGGCRCSFAFDGCMEEPCSNRTAYEIGRHVEPFAQLWDSTIKKADRALYGWEASPWVWVIEFERISREEAHP